MSKQNILLEKLLLSDFTFGFELEAIAPINEFNMFDYLTGSEEDAYYDNELDDDVIENYKDDHRRDGFSNVSDRIEIVYDKTLGEINGVNSNFNGIEDDSSIEPEDDSSIGFEYASPPLPFKPSTLLTVMDFLELCIDEGDIATNDSCGFHIHLSFNNMSETDIAWIYSQMCIDLYNDNNRATEFLTFIDSYEDEIKLFNSGYADIQTMKELGKELLNITSNTEEINISTSKYNVLRIHPQGTLEWRGPRGFLNSGKLKDIQLFFYKLVSFVKLLINYQNSSEIDTISYDEKPIQKNKFLELLRERTQHKASPNNQEYVGSEISVKNNKLFKSRESLVELIRKNNGEVLRQVLTTQPKETVEYIFKFMALNSYLIGEFLEDNENNKEMIAMLINYRNSLSDQFLINKINSSLFFANPNNLSESDVESLFNSKIISHSLLNAIETSFKNNFHLPIKLIKNNTFLEDKYYHFGDALEIFAKIYKTNSYSRDELFSFLVDIFKWFIPQVNSLTSYKYEINDTRDQVVGIIGALPNDQQERWNHSILSIVLSSSINGREHLLPFLSMIDTTDYLHLASVFGLYKLRNIQNLIEKNIRPDIIKKVEATFK